MEDAERERFRAALKAVELEGERTLLEALEPLAVPGGNDPAATIAAAAAAWGEPLTDAEIDDLLRLL